MPEDSVLNLKKKRRIGIYETILVYNHHKLDSTGSSSFSRQAHQARMVD